jgi:hypothetical protein
VIFALASTVGDAAGGLGAAGEGEAAASEAQAEVEAEAEAEAPSQPGDMDPSYPQHEQGTGSYTNTHASGKTYDGKGGTDRMADSAKRIGDEYDDPVQTQVHRPAVDNKQSFIDEQNNLEAHGGPGGNTYNKINSPGKKLRDGT